MLLALDTMNEGVIKESPGTEPDSRPLHPQSGLVVKLLVFLAGAS